MSGKEPFCQDCSQADWAGGEVVSDIYIHTSTGMLRLNLAKLPMCMAASFVHSQGGDLFPDRSVSVDHVIRGHLHQVLKTSHLGACIKGDTCSGNK